MPSSTLDSLHASWPLVSRGCWGQLRVQKSTHWLPSLLCSLSPIVNGLGSRVQGTKQPPITLLKNADILGNASKWNILRMIPFFWRPFLSVSLGVTVCTVTIHSISSKTSVPGPNFNWEEREEKIRPKMTDSRAFFFFVKDPWLWILFLLGLAA